MPYTKMPRAKSTMLPTMTITSLDTPGRMPSSWRNTKGRQQARNNMDTMVRTMASTAALPAGTPAF